MTLDLSPSVSLAEYRIDFIALDGSTALSLLFDEAQNQSGSGSLAWTVADRPWEDGDQLMLRIAEVVP